MGGILVVKGLKVKSIMHVYNFPQWRHVKRERIAKKYFSYNFEEKYKHTKVALSFVLKQCFCWKIHFILILDRDQIVH